MFDNFHRIAHFQNAKSERNLRTYNTYNVHRVYHLTFESFVRDTVLYRYFYNVVNHWQNSIEY